MFTKEQGLRHLYHDQDVRKYIRFQDSRRIHHRNPCQGSEGCHGIVVVSTTVWFLLPE